MTAETLARLEKVYATSPRQIRRWWHDGAPVEDPIQMPEWWAKHRTWGLPDKIDRAARAALASRPPEAGVSLPPSESVPGVKSEESLRISDFQLGEGEAVRNQRQLTGALFEALRKAYESGVMIDVAQRRYEKASESLRRMEVSDRAAQKEMGHLLPKALVRAEIATAVELLRHMRESMVRKVMELCPDLPPEYRGKVTDAIMIARAQEDRVFRNLKSLNSPADVSDLIAA